MLATWVKTLYRLTPKQKCKFCHFFNLIFLSSWKADFLSRSSFDRKTREKKMQIFDQTHGLTPSENCKFCHLLISMFLSSRRANFLSRTSYKTFWAYLISQTVNFLKKWPIFAKKLQILPLFKFPVFII